jgi:hypothetical protein
VIIAAGIRNFTPGVTDSDITHRSSFEIEPNRPESKSSTHFIDFSDDLGYDLDLPIETLPEARSQYRSFVSRNGMVEISVSFEEA